MSDVSVLAQQYETAADLSQAINDAVIVLKKVVRRLPGAEAIPAEQVAASRCRLADVTATLADFLDPTTDLRPVGSTLVTGPLVSRLQAAQQGNLAYFAEDLGQVSKRLRDGSAALSDADVVLLDQLAAAAGAETSHVFRRLMRT